MKRRLGRKARKSMSRSAFDRWRGPEPQCGYGRDKAGHEHFKTVLDIAMHADETEELWRAWKAGVRWALRAL